MIIFLAGWRGNGPPYGEVIFSIVIAGGEILFRRVVR